MREIKFKAWNTKLKEMFENIEEGFECDGCINERYSGNGSDLHQLYNKCGLTDFDSALEDKNMVVMQYIGVKDIEGKEIYEGDICQFGEDEEYSIGIIEWDEANAGFKFFYEAKTFFNLDDEPYKEMEIVGNIHETTAEEKKYLGLTWK